MICIIHIDVTDSKLDNILKDINNTGREKFLDDYINFTSYRKQLEIKDLARKVLEELK